MRALHRRRHHVHSLIIPSIPTLPTFLLHYNDQYTTMAKISAIIVLLFHFVLLSSLSAVTGLPLLSKRINKLPILERVQGFIAHVQRGRYERDYGNTAFHVLFLDKGPAVLPQCQCTKWEAKALFNGLPMCCHIDCKVLWKKEKHQEEMDASRPKGKKKKKEKNVTWNSGHCCFAYGNLC